MSGLIFQLAAATLNRVNVGVPKVNANNASIITILNTVYFWAGLIAVVVIVIAGFIFVTSRGDSQQVTRARNAILGAVIGLVVVLLAFTITQFILGSVV